MTHIHSYTKLYAFQSFFFCSEKTFSKNLHNYNAHMKKSWKHYPFYVYTNKFLKKLVSTIRFFSRADLWSGFSAYRTSQDMIGFLFFMKNYKCITCNILHNHWPGCTFLQIFLRNYRQVQILPGPTNRTRDLVLPTACVTIDRNIIHIPTMTWRF